ncbi:hypothetical protein D3C87_1411330 [compost metagenome]
MAAIKNIPTHPPSSDLASILFTQELGRLISNAPKKDAPKAISIKKKKKLKIPFVDKALSASEPKMIVTANPRITYITMIETP